MLSLKNNKTAIVAAASSGKRALLILSFSVSAHRHMPLGNNVMWTESFCGLVLRLIHLTHAAGGHLVNPPAHIHTWKRRTTPAQHPPHCPIPTCLRISVFIRVVILSPDCVLSHTWSRETTGSPISAPESLTELI